MDLVSGGLSRLFVIGLLFFCFSERSFAPGAPGNSCPEDAGCSDSGLNTVFCSVDAQCSACDPPQQGPLHCDSLTNTCPTGCNGYGDSGSCASAGCTWDDSLVTFDENCCVPGGSPAPEIPPYLMGWMTLILAAIVAWFSLSNKKPRNAF